MVASFAPPKPATRAGIWKAATRRDVEAADKPFEFFMNRFRLLAAPRAEFSLYTGSAESVIRPQIDEALAKGISPSAECWQITEHGKLFLNSLLELFLAEDS